MGDTGTPANEVTLRASSLRTGTVEVRIGSPTGTVIGSIPITATTGGSKDFETYTVQLSTPTSGVRNIYLRGERGAGLTNTIGFINWVRFGHDPAKSLPKEHQVGTPTTKSVSRNGTPPPRHQGSLSSTNGQSNP